MNRSYRLNQIENPLKLWGANLKAITNHSPRLYQGRVACFVAEESVTEEANSIHATRWMEQASCR